MKLFLAALRRLSARQQSGEYFTAMRPSHGWKKMWCVAELNDEYIQRMEEVLDVYERPLNKDQPVICLDEKPMQLLANINPTSRLVRPRRIRKKDYEYSRRGTANAFCVVEPKRGRHMVRTTKYRKSEQFTKLMQEISRRYRRASVIHVVMDNLSTHTEKALIRTLGPKQGTALWARFAVHFTPKHASWLNQAEIEISMFSRQCLGKDRIATIKTVAKRARAWELRMNQGKVKTQWEYTKQKARESFKYKPSKSCEEEH